MHEVHRADHDGQSNGTPDRGNGDIARGREEKQPEAEADQKSGQTEESDDDTAGGGDPLATLEPEPHGKAMSHQRAERRQRAGSRSRLHSCCSAPMKGDENRNESLQEIEEENHVAPLLAQDAQGIGGADIAAPLGPQIDTADFTSDESRRNRSQQIGADRDQKPWKQGTHSTRSQHPQRKGQGKRMRGNFRFL